MSESSEGDRVNAWERRLLIAAFGAWAAVVAAYGQAVVKRVDSVVTEMAEDRKEAAEQRTVMERRITILENNQQYIIRRLEHLEKEHDKISPSH